MPVVKTPAPKFTAFDTVMELDYAESEIGLFLADGRDERIQLKTERFDITRPPTPHLAFGHGLHHCLGANLAIQEGAVAFRHLAGQLPKARLAPGGDAIRWARTGFPRGPAHLTLTWG